jgi:hypothetical protein
MSEPSEYLQHLVKKEYEADELQRERLHNEYVNKCNDKYFNSTMDARITIRGGF